MDVHARYRLLYRAQNIPIVKGRQVARQSALDAHLGCTDLRGLGCFLRNFIRGQKISVRLARTAAESAEFTADKTDIGEINIAIDNVANDISGQFTAQSIRRNQQPEQVIAFSIRQERALFSCQGYAIERLQNILEHGPWLRAHAQGDIGPVQRRKIFQFGLRQSASHSSLLPKQVCRRRPDQIACISASLPVAKSSNDANGRASHLAANQTGGTSEFVRHRFHTSPQSVAVRIARPAIIVQSRHPGYADGDFRKSLPPRPSKTVTNDYRNL